MLNLKLIDAPSVQPVSLDMAKAHCRVESVSEDDLISLYIAAATGYAERRLNKALVSQRWKLSLDNFPFDRYRQRPGRRNVFGFACDYWTTSMSILLPRPPLIEVESIGYLDADGEEIILDPSQYIVDPSSEPARIVPVIGTYWPYLSVIQPAGVTVTFTAGYGTTPSSVPPAIQMAILMLVGHYFENREATSQGLPVTAVPLSVDALLDSHACTVFDYEAA